MSEIPRLRRDHCWPLTHPLHTVSGPYSNFSRRGSFDGSYYVSGRKGGIKGDARKGSEDK